ncbi:UNVERIFIED_CONTAM: hypothetical protein PYX00_004222 [Menopon gallinae]|uniref:Sodium-coupled monocarboxylate transporter 1 n=1 Tax=Menopon gallinae TaxID=328185 RepID=A0AAW2I3B8_9NEOP
MVADERFDTIDYIVFAGMLLVSALIGIYFAFFAKRKQNTVKEYLLGGKEMGIFPISMSLVASSISGIALIGLPSEMYTFGTQLWVTVISEVLAYLTTAFVFLPVLFKLQVTSSYEYLERRYNRVLRKLGSILFILGTMLYIPIVIYVPGPLAFAQVTGISLQLLIPSVCVVCIFYTTLGGMKAVAWTDTVQTMLIFLGVVVVSVIGTVQVGGFSAVWEANRKGGRIEFFNMDPDPTARHTFWTVLIGKYFPNLSFSTVNQAFVQRYLAMPTLRKARLTVVILTFGVVSLISFCCYTGLVIFAAFSDCDPVSAGIVSKPDQLLPYFILKYTSDIPALPGIFVAGVFSAALSTMSTCLNSMTGVVFEDFVRPLFRKPVSDAKASFYMKVIVVLIGTVTVILATIVDKLGGIIQASASLGGITSGTLLGMFILGMLFPWANSTGALVGGIASASLVGWICIGTQVAVTRKQIILPMKPVSVEGCQNITLPLPTNQTQTITSEPFFLYKISYVYYPLIGVVVCVVIGLIVSYFTKMNKPHRMDPDLLSPVIHKYISFIDEEVVNKKLMRAHRNSVDISRQAKEESLPMTDR